MEQIIRHMLAAKGKVYGAAVAEELGLTSGTVAPILVRMEDVGWVKSERIKIGGTSGTARRYYRFTEGSAAMLRKAIE